MGTTKAKDKFLAKEISGAEYISVILRRSLKMMTPNLVISESTFNDWVRAAGTLKGDPIELAAALEWAIVNDQFWTEKIRDMAYFVEKSETILGQYRGAARKKLILERDRASNGHLTPSAQALREKYPNATGPEIVFAEVVERHRKRLDVFKKACKVCKGAEYLPSKINLGCMVPCKVCEVASRKIWEEETRQVQHELYSLA